jgi:hypothetical protein
MDKNKSRKLFLKIISTLCCIENAVTVLICVNAVEIIEPCPPVTKEGEISF